MDNKIVEDFLTEADKKELETKLKQIEERNFNDENKAIESSLLYVHFSQLNQAIKEIKKAELAGSKNSIVYLILADILFIQRDYGLAIKSYEKVIQLASNSKDYNSQEILIIAQIELANCWLSKAQQESENLPEFFRGKFSERLKELVNKDKSLFGSRGICEQNCTIKPGLPSEWRWVLDEKRCVLCSI